MAYDALQRRGTIFTVCNVALTLLSEGMAKAAGLTITKEKAKEEWIANMLPGAHIVASGVLAVNRAQEAGCTYCYAG
jgi:intracellular sulfur oxidation DsrE/DsrF family protein